MLSTYGNVYATFEISAEYLQNSQSQDNIDALELLHILAFLHNNGLSRRMFDFVSNLASNVLETGSTNDQGIRKYIPRLPGYLQRKWSIPGGRTRWRNARSILASLSIVKIEECHGFSEMSLHSLLHAWAKERQDHHTRCQAWLSATTMLALLARTLKDPSLAVMSFIPHVRAWSSHELGNYARGRSDVGIATALLQLGQICGSPWWYGELLSSLFSMRNDEIGEPSVLHLKQHVAAVLPLWEFYKKALEEIVDKEARAVTQDDSVLTALQDKLACASYLNGQLLNELESLQKVANVEQKLPKENLERILARQKLTLEHLKEVAQGILSLQPHEWRISNYGSEALYLDC